MAPAAAGVTVAGIGGNGTGTPPGTSRPGVELPAACAVVVADGPATTSWPVSVIGCVAGIGPGAGRNFPGSVGWVFAQTTVTGWDGAALAGPARETVSSGAWVAPDCAAVQVYATVTGAASASIRKPPPSRTLAPIAPARAARAAIRPVAFDSRTDLAPIPVIRGPATI